MAALLLIAMAGFLQDEKEAEKAISKAIDANFDRYDPKKRSEVAADLQALWRTLPESGDLRERGLMRIVRNIESATHRFPRDQEYRDLRKRHPELPELAVPDRFHVRAYDIVVRQLKVLVANAAAFPSRTAEARAEIADQVSEVLDRAVDAFGAKAGDGEAEKLINETLEKRRKEFLRALDDPFAGYLRPLEAKPLKELKERIARTAEEMPMVGGRSLRNSKPFLDAVVVVHDLGRAHNPSRFAVYDEDNALVEEVQADWKERKQRLEKAYNDKASEELKKNRDPDGY